MPDQKPDHLIVRYLSNEATPDEQEKLFDWVSQNKENQKVFNEYVKLWSLQDKRKDRFSLETGLLKLNQRIDAYEVSEKKKTVFWNHWNIAAAVILLAVSGFVLYHNGVFSYQKHLKASLTETTATDRVIQFNLSDGSIITLNRNASLRYPESFIGNTREVYLTGEAFFEIAKDSLSPFIIHANGITTTVLGTSFNVNASGKVVVVSVATGRVKVSNGKQSEILKANEKLACGDKNFRKESTDLSELQWNSRVLEFNDTNLSRAADMISRYYEVAVTFEHEALKNCQITGKFKNQQLETVLKAIEFSTDVHYQVQNNTVSFSGKGCQ